MQKEPDHLAAQLKTTRFMKAELEVAHGKFREERELHKDEWKVMSRERELLPREFKLLYAAHDVLEMEREECRKDLKRARWRC